MGLILVFLFGIANFAAHRAVLESHHPLLVRMPIFYMLGGRFSLVVEFGILLGAMLVVAQGSLSWALYYGLYTAMHVTSAWLIWSRRI